MAVGIGGSLLVDPPGVYLTEVNVDGTYEGWLMGDPEFEVHAFLAQGTAFTDVSCAGEARAGTAYYWDHNNPALPWTGNTLIAAEAAVSFGQINRLIVQLRCSP